MRASVRRLLLPLLGLLLMPASAAPQARLVEGIDYAGAGHPDQTLDLFLPEAAVPEDPAAGSTAAAGGPPLLVFVHSRFWGPGDRGRDIAHRFARPLQRAGAAVALVRHRPAPASPHPAAASDVAAAVAFLIDAAPRYGYDRRRIHLSGHGSGGHLAALVALDPRYLDAHGYTSRGLRGVAAWSASFDLTDAGAGEAMREIYARAFGDAATRSEASPIRYARADAPTFLLMVAEHDLPGAAEQAEAFAEALRAAGHPAAEMFRLPGRDHWSGLSLEQEKGPARQHLLALLELPGADASWRDTFGMRRFWRDPDFSTLPFWEDEDHATRREADERFLLTLNMPFARPGRPVMLQPSTYDALDLFAYLERNVPGGDQSWRYLVVTNVRGERVVWRREEIEPLRPVIVIGLDDRRQLFELTDFYHTDRRYTWKDEEAEPWVLARPLGAFIHFLEPPPPEVDPLLFGRFALEADAFRVSREDPLAPLRSLDEAEERILTESLRCVSCHSFRGVGARAGHLRARDGELVGGFALPLETYPPEVWRRYCFEQVDVAAEIGASPVALGADAVRLFELVERERAAD